MLVVVLLAILDCFEAIFLLCFDEVFLSPFLSIFGKLFGSFLGVIDVELCM